MNATELLQHLSENAEALSASDRASAALIVAALAMAIVFAVLIVLIFAIKIMGALLGVSKKEETVAPVAPAQIAEEEEEELEDEGELVAVIAAAVAESLGRSVNEIVVTRIQRTDALPAWTQSGALN